MRYVGLIVWCFPCLLFWFEDDCFAMISIGCLSELHGYNPCFMCAVLCWIGQSEQVIRDRYDRFRKQVHAWRSHLFKIRIWIQLCETRHSDEALWAFIGFSHFSEAAESSLRKLNEFRKVKASLITELKSRVDKKSIHGCLRSIPRDFDLLGNPSEEK